MRRLIYQVDIVPIHSRLIGIPGRPMLGHSPQTGEAHHNVRITMNKGKEAKKKGTYNGTVKYNHKFNNVVYTVMMLPYHEHDVLPRRT